MDRNRQMATRTIIPSAVQQNEALRRASAPTSQPHRLIAAGIKRGTGPLRIRVAVA